MDPRLTERPDGPGWAVYRFGTSARARDGRLLIAFYCRRGIFVVDTEWSTTQLDTTGRHLPTYAAIHSISASQQNPAARGLYSVFEAGPITSYNKKLSCRGDNPPYHRHHHIISKTSYDDSL